MNVYRYVITDDTGFAPNPFGLYCTLTTCKPRIRRTAKPGDWILARGSKASGFHGKLVYAMKVGEILTLDAYYHDLRFQYKKPQRDGSPFGLCGDNLYYLDDSHRYQQDKNAYYHTCQKNREDDTEGKYALVSTWFFYFGSQAVQIPPKWLSLFPPKQDHFVKDDYCLIPLIEWLQESFQPGLYALPLDYVTPKSPKLISLSPKMETN